MPHSSEGEHGPHAERPHFTPGSGNLTPLLPGDSLSPGLAVLCPPRFLQGMKSHQQGLVGVTCLAALLSGKVGRFTSSWCSVQAMAFNKIPPSVTGVC